MSDNFPWDILGIGQTADSKAIRSAYAAKLKALDIDKDVAGYETLRHARDEALFLARQNQSQDDLGLGPALADEPVDPTAPLPDRQIDDALHDPVAPLEGDPELGKTGDRSDAIAPIGEAEVAGTQDRPQPGSEAPNRLLAIILPNGEQSTTALTAEEYVDAIAQMRQVFADADGVSLDVQHGIEHWLGHQLASAWPRSGPLVEEAHDHFGWGAREGLLDEEPAIAFLNDRLRAIRKVAEIEQPDHKYHHEWMELKKPGARGFSPFRKAKAHKVEELLVAIREQYPEVEDYLSPQRVESWIAPQSSGGIGQYLWVGIAIVLIGSRIISSVADDDNRPGTEMHSSSILSENWTDEERQQLLDRLFGTGVSYSTLSDKSPVIAEAFDRQTRERADGDTAEQQAFDELSRVLRYQSRRAAAWADFDDLVAIQQHRLNTLRMVRDQGSANDCFNNAISGNIPARVVPSAEFEQAEASLFRRLLVANNYAANDAQLPQTASVPGWTVDMVMNKIAISRPKFQELSKGEGNPDEQCAYTIAMMEAVLSRPGDVPAELLRMM